MAGRPDTKGPRGVNTSETAEGKQDHKKIKTYLELLLLAFLAGGGLVLAPRAALVCRCILRVDAQRRSGGARGQRVGHQ